jgi:hypothetical protein
MSEELQNPVVGQAVIYVDEVGVEHNALLTAVHGIATYTSVWSEDLKGFDPNTKKTIYPCVNLLYVTKEDAKIDPYGRQISRASSVSHKDSYAAHGRYWK